MPPDKIRLAENLARVRERIAAAGARSGRAPESVRLVAVTKTVDAETIRALRDLGAEDFGENRVEPGLEKVQALGDAGCRWHFIGHLQRNKAKRALAGFRRFHGVESVKLAEILQTEANVGGYDVDAWIEVNVSGEESKYGVAPADAEALAAAILGMDRLRLRGWMTMAPYAENPEAARPVFRALRELRDAWRAKHPDSGAELSMGMSGDFEVAIEEGATLVRVGSALFE